MASRVMISFPEAFLKQVDKLARAEHRSRSALVREALRYYIEARYGAMRPGDLPQVRAAVESMNALAKVSPGTNEDSTVDVRNWRDARR